MGSLEKYPEEEKPEKILSQAEIHSRKTEVDKSGDPLEIYRFYIQYGFDPEENSVQELFERGFQIYTEETVPRSEQRYFAVNKKEPEIETIDRAVQEYRTTKYQTTYKEMNSLQAFLGRAAIKIKFREPLPQELDRSINVELKFQGRDAFDSHYKIVYSMIEGVKGRTVKWIRFMERSVCENNPQEVEEHESNTAMEIASYFSSKLEEIISYKKPRITINEETPMHYRINVEFPEKTTESR